MTTKKHIPQLQYSITIFFKCLVFKGTWIYAIILTMPPAFGWNRFISIPSRISCHPDWYSSKLSDKAYIIYLTLFGFFIPLIVIILSFTGIYRYSTFLLNK